VTDRIQDSIHSTYVPLLGFFRTLKMSFRRVRAGLEQEMPTAGGAWRPNKYQWAAIWIAFAFAGGLFYAAAAEGYPEFNTLACLLIAAGALTVWFLESLKR
jgi:hypothetical protein